MQNVRTDEAFCKGDSLLDTTMPSSRPDELDDEKFNKLRTTWTLSSKVVLGTYGTWTGVTNELSHDPKKRTRKATTRRR